MINSFLENVIHVKKFIFSGSYYDRKPHFSSNFAVLCLCITSCYSILTLIISEKTVCMTLKISRQKTKLSGTLIKIVLGIERYLVKFNEKVHEMTKIGHFVEFMKVIPFSFNHSSNIAACFS